MSTIAEIRTAFAAQLTERLPEGTRVEKSLPGQVNGPAVVLRRQGTTYATTQAGQSHDLTWSVVIFVSLASQRTAEDLLDEFVDAAGARSVYAAVAADPTIGGTVDFATVVEAGPDEIVQYQGVDFLSVAITVATG